MSRTLKIGARLAIAFGALVVLTLALTAFAIYRMGEASAVVDAERTIRTTQLTPLYELREALDQTGIAARNAYIYEAKADAERELNVLDQQSAIVLNRLGKLTTVLGGAQDFDIANRDLKEMAGALSKPREFRNSGDMKEFGRFLVEDCSPLRRRIVAELDTVISRIEGQLTAASKQVDVVSASSRTYMYCIAVFAVLLGSMLGVRREGITEAAGKLQAAGHIRYRRGHIAVLNRAGLKARACECYVVVKKETGRLMLSSAHHDASSNHP